MKASQKKIVVNQMKTEFRAISENERLARTLVCALLAPLDVTVDELADVRCAVSEAVTNSIVHGYGGGCADRTVYILTTLYADRSVKIVIRDRGVGIADVDAAMEPLFTTDKSGERSGMGFAIMKTFMDSVRVRSTPGLGTTVELKKTFAPLAAQETAEDVQTQTLFAEERAQEAFV
ncbi:MAG: anti-sigma F factor [Clostridia bacterium]|nr:anti-sigma F factor [Clostridia bacterium]